MVDRAVGEQVGVGLAVKGQRLEGQGGIFAERATMPKLVHTVGKVVAPLVPKAIATLRQD